MATKLPWMKFFPSDWRTDPALSMCSPATRGIWFDLLCAMHADDRRGELRGTLEALSRVGRCLPDEMAKALAELTDTGAADVTKDDGDVTAMYTVRNRRMYRDAQQRDRTKKRVQKHREKRSCNAVEVRSQKSEIRNQKENTPPTPQGGKRVKFQKPSKEEVEAYCQEKGYHFDAEAFVAHYESNGWKVGRNPMKKWQAACVTWERVWKEKHGADADEYFLVGDATPERTQQEDDQ